MGYSVKQKSAGWYAKLLVLYPAAYRRHYAQPMVQTFDDLLDSEASKLGRCMIWTRALWDLPSNALKQHLTNGEEYNMSRNAKIILSGAALLLLIANGASFWFGSLHARQAETVQRVTSMQLADAMKQDQFYSSYGNTVVIFSAKVMSVQVSAGAPLVRFETNRTYSLTCQFPESITAKVGQTISVVAPAGSAERQKTGVLLRDCIEN